MCFNAFQCVSMGFNAFQCVSMRFNAFQCVSMGFNAFQWVSIGFNVFQCVRRKDISPFTIMIDQKVIDFKCLGSNSMFCKAIRTNLNGFYMIYHVK